MCECLAKVNEELAKHNTRIEIPWIGPQVPFVQTIKRDEKKRGKPVRMFATFCPFCGVKYPTERTASELLHETRHPTGETDAV